MDVEDYPSSSNSNYMPFRPANGYTYPSGSKSANASPGPMQRFKQYYGNEYPKANFNQVNQHTLMWMDNYSYSRSECGGSRSPSVMSGMSNCSAATNMSQLTILTDITDMTAMTGPVPPKFHSDPIHNENISVGCDIVTVTRGLIDELRDFNKNPGQTFMTIKDYARVRSFDYIQKYDLQCLMDSILGRIDMLSQMHPSTAEDEEQKDKLISQGFVTFYHVVHASDRSTKAFLEYSSIRKHIVPNFLCSFLNPGKEHAKLVLNSINTLFMKTGQSRVSKHYIQKYPKIIDIFMDLLRTESKPLLKIAFNTLVHLLAGKPALKDQFFQKKGLDFILNVLQNENDEKVLYGATALLHILLSDFNKNKDIFVAFVQYGGIHICAKHLDHGSPRFLNFLMSCLASVGDLKELTQNLDLKEPIQSVLKLLGSTDYRLVNNGIGFIGNTITTNDQNKVYLIQINGPRTLVRVIQDVMLNRNPHYASLFEDIIENALWALGLLLNNINIPEEMKNSVIDNAMGQIISFDHWAVMFLNILEQEPCLTISRALYILNTIFGKHRQVLNYFDQKFSQGQRMNIVGVIYRKIQEVVKILNCFDQITWNFGPPNYHRLNSLSNEQRIDQLKQLLTRMFKLANFLIELPWSRQQIVNFLKNDYESPFYFMQVIAKYPMAYGELIFLGMHLAESDQGLGVYWTQNPDLVQSVYNCMHNPEPIVANAASNFYNRLHQISATYNKQISMY